MNSWPPPIITKNAKSAANLAADGLQIWEYKDGRGISVINKEDLPGDKEDWKYVGQSEDLRRES